MGHKGNPLSSVDAPDGATDAPATDPVREEIVARLRGALGDGVVEVRLDAGRDLWVRIAATAWRQAGEVLRDQVGCTYFCFLSVIDWKPSPFGRSMDSEVDNVLENVPQREPEEMTHGYAGGDTRFQILARVTSIADRIGITIKADVPEDTLTIDSWSAVYAGANWHEREAWEMFGVSFAGHPNLKKLYLPGDFEGFPLRKDFPLLARMVKPWPGIVDVEGMPGVADDEGGE